MRKLGKSAIVGTLAFDGCNSLKQKLSAEKEDISKVISDALKNPIIRSKCTIIKTSGNNDNNNYAIEQLTRLIGYCILFKSNEGVVDYMSIPNHYKQFRFLKEKIASKLNIPTEDIEQNMDKIVEYALENFIQNGYVFHAGNSKSIEKKMKNGLEGNSEVHISHQSELLEINRIYQRYGPVNSSPLGWGAIDVKNQKTGWFYSETPRWITDYANSPEWFCQLCGGNIIYSNIIPPEKRYGYQNRDRDTAEEVVTTLIEQYDMSEEDKNKIMKFFNKCWELYGDSEPEVILIPISKILPTSTLAKRKDFFRKYQSQIFEDIITFEGYARGENEHSMLDIPPQYLSCVNLTPIMPRIKIQRNTEEQIILKDLIKKLKGFSLEDLKVAQAMIDKIEKNKGGALEWKTKNKYIQRYMVF